MIDAMLSTFSNQQAGIYTGIAFFLLVSVICLVLSFMVSSLSIAASEFFGVDFFRLSYTPIEIFIRVWAITLSVALIGGFSGYLGGSSRSSAVGDILPAVLTVLGGYIAYIMGESRENSPRVAIYGFTFVLAFFLLYITASVWRQDNEAFEFCKSVYSDPDFAASAVVEQRDDAWSVYCNAVFARWTTQQS